ncbi:TetR/AcrR family transcriptional regulator, transcriptional repressor for nem operon [Cupriavidus metallidurans]|jgi:TetR/AcrR family transcriptional regulator, transcriptional repressor for nem operon|uniref:TetR/AcrR family transcriptional regulator n=2 Tax=Cupriavidus metallidurans TaxID=119219 RepID=Q1LDK5_CUPMC|nr:MULTISPECIES: TetR/AcrR family transcriptional regulator [Cupriavidus]PCH56211.1 MAG: TetR/AcrR family transcriptional regulator [Burkholderiaceae bacterium]ABF11771.1 TetR/AcrR family transcriptional regulator [Cupriavidus metallidurans CH34]AVA34059.1 TetR/AcrR family transcriptional regulator [Cupriavidus metallidurans]KWR79979.1 TetR family transcriptional regulator [Cupriavidus sp. SHE]KWW35126.1 HTH-type transcriptional regulator RutR [Cupriavidus metallidurans]
MKTSSVREQLLEHASVLMRRRGYNGFSYRDLAELVGVKTSSIHYYFPSKDDLVLEVVRQYRQTSVARLAAIDTSLPLIEQARKYVLPLSNGIDLGQICLIGMLAAEVMVLPQAVRALLQEHFQANENFIADMLRRAEAERGQQYPVPPQLLAKVLYGAIQNGLITARMSGSNDRIDAAANMLIGAVGGSMCAIEEHEAVAA